MAMRHPYESFPLNISAARFPDCFARPMPELSAEECSEIQEGYVDSEGPAQLGLPHFE
jgi:hypothetical protein